jgi:hypothetical protein
MSQSNDLIEYLRSRQVFILIAIAVAFGLARQFALIFLGVRDISLPSPLGSISPQLKVLYIWWFLMFFLSGGLVLGMMLGKIRNTRNRIIYPFIYLMFLLLYVEF